MTTPTPPDWTPSSDDVGAVIARLVPDDEGLAKGQFTDDSVPSEEQVLGLIRRVTADVALTVGEVPEVAYDVARDVVALGVGARIVDGFFPEAKEEFVDRLYGRFTGALERLRGNVQRLAGSDADGPGNDPQGSFPVPYGDYDLLLPGSRPRGPYGGVVW